MIYKDSNDNQNDNKDNKDKGMSNETIIGISVCVAFIVIGGLWWHYRSKRAGKIAQRFDRQANTLARF